MDQAKRRAQSTYNAAADHFDDAALGFWDRYGQATVERLQLRRGTTELDVCSGAGASALPAAARVAPTGRVVAVDLAENLLALARRKAERSGLSSVLSTRCADVDTLDETDEKFDAVIVVFGLFFFPDMTAATARLWRLVAPGGVLAVTTWGRDCLSRPAAYFGRRSAREASVSDHPTPLDVLAARTHLPPCTPTGAGARARCRY